MPPPCVHVAREGLYSLLAFYTSKTVAQYHKSQKTNQYNGNKRKEYNNNNDNINIGTMFMVLSS